MEKRKNYIDIVKGISIIAIVLLHYEDGIIPSSLNTFIGMFMITAFYLTSGWLQGQSNKKTTVKELIRKRIPTLIKPYLWFSLIILIFDALLIALGYEEPKLLLIDLYKTITLRGIGTLWFLPALLGGEIIFVYLRDKHVNYKLFALAGTLFYLFLYLEWSISLGYNGEFYRIIDAPFRTLKNILEAWVVIAAGYYLSNMAGTKIFELSNIKKIILIVGLTSFSFYLIENFSKFPAIIIVESLILHIITPIILLLFVMLTEQLYFNKFFIYWGKNSLVLMVTHYSILMEICIILNTYWTGSAYFGGMNAIYFFIATILIEYLIVYFINSKAKFLIGK